MSIHNAPADSTGSRLPTLRDLVAPVFRHRRAGLAVSAAVFLAAVATVVALPNRYESDMKILVKRERLDPILSADPNVTSQPRVEVTEEELNSEVELLKSTDLLQEVAVVTGMVPASTDWGSATQGDASRIAAWRVIDRLRKDLRIALLRKTTLISVSYSAPDPQQAVNVLDTLAQLYLEKHLQLHRPAGADQFLTEQTEYYRKELAAAEGRLTDYARREQIVSADLERNTALQTLAQFEASLQQVGAAIADADHRIAELQSQVATTSARHTTQIRTSEDAPLSRELKSRILELEVKEGELLRKFTPTYPAVVEVEGELARARAALERSERSPLIEETTDQNPTHQWIEGELARVRAERSAAVARAAAIAASVRVYKNKARELDEKAAAQADLIRARKTAEDNFLLYTRKQEEARISDALDRTRITNVAVANKAIAPAVPSHGGRAWLLLLGAMLAVMIGTATTYLLDYLRPRFHTPGDIERALDIPVLATLTAE